VKLLRVGDLAAGGVFKTVHTRRLGVVLEQDATRTHVELDGSTFGEFEQKSLASRVRVYTHEVRP
jgi:hypothetical protein